METLQRTANRGSVSTGFNIDNSVKVENDNREYLRWTNFSNYASSARKKKFSMSVWVKRTEIGRQMIFWSTANNGYFSFDAGDTLTWIQQYGGSQLVIRTNRVFRDTSAWYHLMVVVDTAQGTEANRTKIYVNGVQETSFDTATYPSQNAESSNLYEQHLILGEWGGGSTGFSGYIAEYYFLSEIAASPTDLGEFDSDTGIWIPKAYDGTITTPSQFLEFKDGSDLGTATSGLDADYLENISAADQATDTPTNNFTTWNQLVLYDAGSYTFPNGATEIKKGASNGWVTVYGNIGVNKGKWYAEFEVLASGELQMMGQLPLTKIQGSIATQFYLGAESNGTQGSGYYTAGTTGTDYIYYGGGYDNSNTVTSAGDVISVAMDCDNNKVFYGVNGTYVNSSNPANNTGGYAMSDDYQFFASSTYTQDKTFKCNFGGFTTDTISSAASDGNGYGTFEYAPPSGYYALCTKNLAEFG